MDDISFEIFTLLNPSNEPFDIIYNNKLFRTIPPGKAIRLPKKPFGLLAEKHLIDRMVQLENKQVNDQLARDKWRAKIVIDENKDLSEGPVDPDTILQRKLDRLNLNDEQSGTIKECQLCNTKTFNIEEHMQLNHATPVTDPVPTPVITPEQTNTNSVEIVDGIAPAAISVETPAPQTDAQKHAASILGNVHGKEKGEAYVLPEVQIEDEPAPVIETKRAELTRDTLITYARDTLKMNIDDTRTKTLLETLPIPDLARELGYEG